MLMDFFSEMSSVCVSEYFLFSPDPGGGGSGGER